MATVTEAVASLLPVLGSGVADATSAVVERTVPAAAEAGTFITMAKVAVAFRAKDVALQLIVPVCPTAGGKQVQPAGDVRETKVAFTVPAVLLAVGSVIATPDAEEGP